MEIKVYIDGASRGNPGKAGVGVVIQHEKKVIGFATKWIGNNVTNNFSEYEALIFGLERLIANGLSTQEHYITIFTDSKLIVDQINGKNSIKSGKLLSQWEKSISLMKVFPNIFLEYTPKKLKHNKLADKLANLAIDFKLNT